jgi:RNA polymerase sigma factor (sigma-70 family)
VVSLDEGDAAHPPTVEITLLDEALTALSAVDERQGQLVELRFFGGLTFEEAAEVLGISTPTAKRDWQLAKAWLYRELKRSRARPQGRAPR